MPEHEWVFAIEDEKLREDVVRVVFPKGVPILLLKKAGKILDYQQIHAMLNKCAHMACELASGNIEGYTITCPCHDWRFDIRTGEFLDAKEIRIPTYEPKLENGKIFLKI